MKTGPKGGEENRLGDHLGWITQGQQRHRFEILFRSRQDLVINLDVTDRERGKSKMLPLVSG